ncbi:hypothetical protein BDZ45DRAFT_747847 [Acephala macrosclerotiorum]|nr:hypothetical protein BDZ45DRAFT_747847 [Acephala macrosclerotiorum]
MSPNKDDKTSDSDSTEKSIGKTSDKEVELGLLKTFELFPKIPIELRSKVWTLCLPHATTIRLEGYSVQNQQFGMVFNAKPDGFVVALFRVCKESRDVLIKHLPYQLPLHIKGMSCSDAIHHLRFGDVDTIHIDGFDVLYTKYRLLLSMQDWVAKVKKLSVVVKNNWKVDWPQLLEDFNCLQKLEIECKLVFLPNTWLSRHWKENQVELKSLKEYRAGDKSFPEIVVREGFSNVRALWGVYEIKKLWNGNRNLIQSQPFEKLEYSFTLILALDIPSANVAEGRSSWAPVF